MDIFTVAIFERTDRMPSEMLTDAEFRIPSEGRYVALVRKGVRWFASEAGFDESCCQDIEVATGEAVTNAVSHGCPQSAEGRVSVRCRVIENRLVVEVEDEGHASCPPKPKAGPLMHSEHGRGLQLIHRLMDQVSIRCTDKGLLIRMVKRHYSHTRPSLNRTMPAIKAV